MTEARFYTVSDARFFTGTVALLNSLRLTGHEQELVVLDAGLRAEQRALLERDTTIADVSLESSNPMLLKPYPYLEGASGTAVVIDSDIIVTGSLGTMIDAAARGRICVLSDDQPYSDYKTNRDRWFAEWEDLLGLEAPPRRGTYVNVGVIALSTQHFPDLLRRWWETAQRVPFEATAAGGAEYDSPFWDSDQDVLNALLMSEVPEGVVMIGVQEASDALAHVEIRDADRLDCVHRGRPTLALHYTGSPKPWEPPALLRVQPDAFVRLLPRVLLQHDVRLRLTPADVPPWLRGDARGRSYLAVAGTINRLARKIVRRTSGKLRRRLTDLRDWLTGPR